MRLAIIAAVLLLGSAPALADPMVCASDEALKSALAKGRTHETPAAVSVDVLGRPVVLYIGPDGDWSLAVIMKATDGRRMACLMTAGDRWQTLPVPIAGKNS